MAPACPLEDPPLLHGTCICRSEPPISHLDSLWCFYVWCFSQLG